MQIGPVAIGKPHFMCGFENKVSKITEVQSFLTWLQGSALQPSFSNSIIGDKLIGVCSPDLVWGCKIWANVNK